jgi:hypothetical protein
VRTLGGPLMVYQMAGDVANWGFRLSPPVPPAFLQLSTWCYIQSHAGAALRSADIFLADAPYEGIARLAEVYRRVLQSGCTQGGSRAGDSV